ncbi:hypothetical protein KPL71_014411 [Citrus sinensis]|uniref:Uncharacterized protein n=1 Tax=Citrus sinensis TaxID=2711 RepID=A0ACB8KBH4_CITSI|nr:hypothetical protein KPL71_014411 [Citrus sinensis]
MADAIVSSLLELGVAKKFGLGPARSSPARTARPRPANCHPYLEQLTSVAADEVKQQARLVTGVRQEVKKLTINLEAIRAVLEDAEKRQMQHDKAVTLWLDQLKDASYDMEDVLEEWTTSRLKLQIEGVDDDNALALAPYKKKVRSFFCAVSNCFGSFKQLCLRHDIAVKIRGINEKLDDIASQKDKFNFKFDENVSNNVKKPERVRTTSLIDEGEVCGRVDEKNELLSKLLCESSEQQQGLHVISLVGLGGIGKTTLAQLAYNNDEVKRNFEKVIWVCVSDTFEEIRVAKAIIEGLGESKEASGLSEFQSLISHIQRSIEGKKFFLILDDVWDGNYNKWEPFFLCLKNGHHRSKILVTTRNESVALMMRSTNIISIKQLAEEECWSLFEQLAFFGCSFEDREKLEPMGRKIAHKCKGLPLAAKVIGNLLRSKSTIKEWQIILESEMWKVEEIGQGLLAPLLLSYNDLPSNSMVKRELINLWMAQGYLNADEDEEMEMIGEEYFNILATRSFFQEFEKDDDDDDIMSCKMHDIVHDFAQFVGRKECLWLEINGTKESIINSFGEKVRHLGLNFEEDASFPMSIHGLNRLRTLLIYDESPHNRPLSSSILSELFNKLACLRALVIRQYNTLGLHPETERIREIPENVGKLIHLKYLNLSGQCIERLPETLCELYNLQKLDIRGCEYLRELPAGIGKLKNMRSLLNAGTDSLKYMPVGISKLTSLRTLQKFVVGGGVDGSNTCRLESLKNLQLLRECRVEGLSNVSHVDGTESGEGEEGRRKNEKDKQLLEALQPPLNVEKLGIEHYGGDIFPKWLTSLTNLRNLYLSSCFNCEHLPPLGKFPLEKLTLWSFRSVKRVGNEFLGIEESSEDDPSSSSSSSSVTAFTKLKSLEIWDMNELEEWNYRITRKENISIMPRLSSLTVESCNKLKALPDYLLQTTALQKLSICACTNLEELSILEDRRTTDIPRLSSLRIWFCPKLKVLLDYLLRTTTLQELSIMECPILENRYREGKGEDWHKISHIPHITWFPDSRKCQNHTSNSQVQSNLVLMMQAGEYAKKMKILAKGLLKCSAGAKIIISILFHSRNQWRQEFGVDTIMQVDFLLVQNIGETKD